MEGIRSLKGVGDYTAAAIGSIAFGMPVAVVDGNVYRVLARHYGISTPINTTEGKHEFAALAQALLPESEASAYNQGMMDFGALVCTPQSPRCMECPLQETCVALHEERVGELPVKQKTLKIKERHLTYIYIRYNNMTAIHRRGEGDIWQGLYEPWLVEQVPEDAMLIRKDVKHVLTHRVIYADFWLWEPEQQPVLPEDYYWIKEKDWDQYGVPRLVEIMLDEINKNKLDKS
jgi:A/G-specific adenine glycosylase